ncbi:bestrophin family protein [Niabella insulamsoli]|uniref:bestrophin family protein n=1 Tax=Niabella insulamsoli TaxID=3144874 RepID=UPI0031FBBDD5
MYTTRFIRLRYLVPSSFYTIFVPLISSTLVYVLFSVLGYTHLTLPLLPITLIGTAVSFYVGFKNNSSYDRMWEARRIWGGIVNSSRMWGTMVLQLVKDKEKSTQLIHRHIAWCNMLRLQLRKNKVWSEKYYQRYTSSLQRNQEISFEEKVAKILSKYVSAADYTLVKNKGNIASYLLHLQNSDLKLLKDNGTIDAMEYMTICNIIQELYNQQGGCERIKNYPFPRQYAVFSRLFVDIFMFILPFGLMTEVIKLAPTAPWLIFPACLIVSWVFNWMEQVGDFSENPFENAVTDVPMSAMCRSIGIDLQEMMGAEEVQERLQPVNGILM